MDAIRQAVDGSCHKRWCEAVACLGAISFIVSDSVLAINRFKVEVPGQRFIVMVTYYAAQLLITLSVVRNRGPAVVGRGGKKKKAM